jgi:hypothetical protein
MAPGIKWTTPIPTRVYSTDGNSEHRAVGFLCRICVAQLGLKAGVDHDRLFATEESCLQHIEDAHVGAGPAGPHLRRPSD